MSCDTMNSVDTPLQQEAAAPATSSDQVIPSDGTSSERTPSVVRLSLDSLGDSDRAASNSAKSLRKRLESAVVERYGVVDMYRARLIQSACRHEAAVKEWSRRKRESFDQWTPETALRACSFIAARVKDGDAAIERLGIRDVASELSLSSLYELIEQSA